ncbi:hypothetical protein [Arthrobacter sp. TE12232]
MTNHPETPEMKDALPAQSSLGQVVDLDMKTGAFPSSGADLTFTLNDPLPADKVAFIANWDAGSQTWIPLASETSPDGRSVRARLSHFSTYGLSFWSNLTGKLLGVRTNPPNCPAPPAPPSWDDNSAPQYFDDINGPILWCAGADPANPDDLEIKLKLNRGAAAAITTAIKPVWTHSDLWQDDTPETWTQMVLAVGLQTGGPNPLVDTADSYFIQPTGEYTFRFAKADVLNFWHADRTKPLIQVDATIPYVVAGLLYAQASDLSAIPALPLVTTLMALNQCSSEILSTGVDLHLSASSQKALASKIPGLMATLATCMASQMDSIVESVAKYWAKNKPASSLPLLEKSARFAGKGLMAAARLYALLQALAPVADALTDLLLDPIARQFIFQPSDQALKDFLRPKPTATGAHPENVEGNQIILSLVAPTGQVVVPSVITKGQIVGVTATGQISYGYEGTSGCAGNAITDPDGNRSVSGHACTPKLDQSAPLPTAPIGALIARVGTSGPWNLIGSKGSITAAASGNLYLAYNDSYLPDDSGSYTLQLRLLR